MPCSGDDTELQEQGCQGEVLPSPEAVSGGDAEAYLTEDDYFEEILHNCNVIMDSLGLIIHGAYDYVNDKDMRKFSAICVISTGFGGDMPDELADELLDDIDFYYDKVRCRKIEQLRRRRQ